MKGDSTMNKIRTNGALDQLKAIGISQILINDPQAIFYFTGKLMFPGERLLALYLADSGKCRLFLNKLMNCPEDLGVEKIWLDDTDDPAEIISGFTDHSSPLGVDKDLPARFLLPLMEKGAGSSFVNASVAIDRQRAVKDPDEQAAMIRSSQINDAAMAEFRALIRPGVTEREIAKQIPGIYKAGGADRMDFGIVAFGSNAADPHHSPDDTVLKEGDCVLLDVGCVANHYCSDMTRTFFFRSVSEKAAQVYEIVRQANVEAEKAIRPGMRFCDIDRIARDIITKAGYGPYFTHRLGHSIGLVDHEFGDVSSANEDIIRPGMTFSIEPGIYLPGEFGVRIEDLVLVTEDGCMILNQYTKDLIIL